MSSAIIVGAARMGPKTQVIRGNLFEPGRPGSCGRPLRPLIDAEPLAAGSPAVELSAGRRQPEARSWGAL